MKVCDVREAYMISCVFGYVSRESIQTPQIEILTESWSMYLALVP